MPKTPPHQISFWSDELHKRTCAVNLARYLVIAAARSKYGADTRCPSLEHFVTSSAAEYQVVVSGVISAKLHGHYHRRPFQTTVFMTVADGKWKSTPVTISCELDRMRNRSTQSGTRVHAHNA